MTKLVLAFETLRDLAAVADVIMGLGGTCGTPQVVIKDQLPGLGAAFQEKVWHVSFEAPDSVVEGLLALLSSRIAIAQQ